jgi:hypothetical protein
MLRREEHHIGEGEFAVVGGLLFNWADADGSGNFIGPDGREHGIWVQRGWKRSSNQSAKAETRASLLLATHAPLFVSGLLASW